MSLINQVLQDLDRRHLGAAANVAPAGVAAARRDAQPARWLAAVAVAAAAVALVLALTLSGAFARVDARSQTPATTPTIVAASTPIATPAVASAQSVTPTPTSTVSATVAPSVSPSLRVATAATFRPAPAVSSALLAPVASPTPIAAAVAAPATVAAARHDARRRGAPPLDDTPAADDAADRVAVATAAPQLDKRTPPASARERADAAYRRGLDAHRDGRDGAAEAAFALALQEDPRHAAARQALAVVLAGRQRGDAAESLLVEGLALDARQPPLATTLARLKAGRGDVAGAIAVLEGQDGAAAQALLATLLQSAGRHGEAIERYALALQLVPGNGSWWAGLSVSLAAVGRHDTAREALLRARASESTAPELQPWIEQRLRAGTRAATASN